MNANTSNNGFYEISRKVFSEIYLSGIEQGLILGQNNALCFPEAPNVIVMPNGDVFGNYIDLNKALKKWGLKAMRNSSHLSFEAHHLLENSQMQTFGLDRYEGLCVAIDHYEHMNLVHGNDCGENVGLTVYLPSSSRFHIWDVVDAHIDVYNSIGRTEWVKPTIDYVITRCARIIAAYESRKVFWATSIDVQMAKDYLISLKNRILP